MRPLAILLILCCPLYALCQSNPRVVHVYVALCDNESQGIVPVTKILGNGDDPANNLYWGAYYGVKSFFNRSANWQLINCEANKEPIIERCVFKHRSTDTYLIADAYRGNTIKQCIQDFVDASAGKQKTKVQLDSITCLDAGGSSPLLVYVGHDGLMEFTLEEHPAPVDSSKRDVMILACASKTFFNEPIAASGAYPIVWTTNLMAPEAYTLENAIEGWIMGENNEAIRMRAAQAYHDYQKCGINGAKRLFATGF